MKKIIVAATILLLIAVLASVLYFRAVNQSSPPVQATKGVSFSPRGFTQGDFTDFFQRAKEAGGVVSWVGDWNELSNGNGAPWVVASLAQENGCTAVVEAQFFTQSSGELLRPLNDTVKQAYKDSAVDFARQKYPAFFGFGVEVNALYEKSPSDYQSFGSFFSEVYDAVKSVSPDTKVFTVFQLEKMKGLNGGLFGGVNNASANEWSLLDDFAKSDLAAFTTYPSLVFKDPSEIPADYYAEIKLHTSKPVAFVEIGWHSASSPVGWESSETEQASFVSAFFNLTGNVPQELSIWSFMYDQNVIEPFNTMGLIKSDGTEKQAWNKWRQPN